MSIEEEVKVEEVKEEVVEEVKVEEDVMAQAMPDHNGPIVTVRKLLEAGVHFGHQTRKWNPKMKPYIYTSRNGMYVIDLTKTQVKLSEAYLALKKIVEDGGKVIFVGTKKQAQEIIKEEALRSGSFYSTSRWIGGTLTNFKTVRKSIETLKRIETMEEDGTFQVLPKKEVAEYYKLKEKLEKNYGGIREMLRTPQALLVVDPKEEENAVREARKLRIPVFAIVNTSSDPDLVDYVIPGNDVGSKAIKFVISLMADAIVEAKGGIPTVAYMKEEGEEATMDDVMDNVERVNEAIALRKQQEAVARREAALKNQRRQNGPRKNGPRPVKETAPVEQPEEAPVEQPEETPVETPVEQPTKPARKPRAKKAKVEETTETPVEQPTEVKVEKEETTEA